MLDHLPIELLQVVLSLLDNRDLCSVSTLSRLLHVICLQKLFTENQTFTPSATSLLRSHSSPESEFECIRPKDGLCINLTSPENSNILTGLRLALPFIFAGQTITAIKCAFNGPFFRTLDEMDHLIHFLLRNSISSTIEVVHLTFDATASVTECLGDLCLQDIDLILNFFRLFGDEEKRLPQCKSLTVVNGHIFNKLLINLNRPSWLRSGTKSANLVQTFTTMTSQGFSSLYKPKATPPGLCALDIDSCFILQYLFNTKRSTTTFHQTAKAIRTLSLSRVNSLWFHILACITLPNLEELYLSCSHISLNTISSFLVRHRKIKILHISGHPSRLKNPVMLPPFFLPNLVHLVLPSSLLPYFPKSATLGLVPTKPFPKLTTITLPIFMFWDESIFYMLERIRIQHLSKRLDNLSVTLRMRFHVMTATTRWLVDNEDSPIGLATICDRVRILEISLSDNPEFLETEDVELLFPSWLRLFPVVETVEIWGCSELNEKNKLNRERLFGAMREGNPTITGFCVGGHYLQLESD